MAVGPAKLATLSVAGGGPVQCYGFRVGFNLYSAENSPAGELESGDAHIYSGDLDYSGRLAIFGSALHACRTAPPAGTGIPAVWPAVPIAQYLPDIDGGNLPTEVRFHVRPD